MAGLTGRQNEVLTLLAAGLSSKEVAFAIGISDSAVRQHAQAIRRCAEEITGRRFSNMLGAAFALVMAGEFQPEKIENAHERVARSIRD